MDDIILQYLKPKDDETSKPSSVPTNTDDSQHDPIVRQYLKPANAPTNRLVVHPRAPFSGVSPEESNRINAELDKPENQVGDTNAPTALQDAGTALKAGGTSFMDSVRNAGALGQSGINDLFTNQPASGAGKIGLAGLSLLGAPSSAVSGTVTNATGSPEIGDAASLVAGALPVAKAGKMVNAALPKNKALDILVDKITSNGRDPQALVDTISAMKSDPRIAPADTSPAVQNMTQKLFTTEGDAAKNYLYSTSKDRVNSSPAAVNDAFNTAGGMPVNAVDKLNQLKAAAAKVGREQINPAVTGAGAVNISPVLEHIDSVLKPGVMKQVSGESTLPFNSVKQAISNVRGMIANKDEQLTDAATLHSFQSALRREAEARISSADGGQRQLGQALMQVRNKVVDAIDAASPKDASGNGTYKPALSNFRDEKDIDNAFHDAYNGVLTNSKALENRPEFTEDWYKGLNTNEKEAVKQGLRTRIDTEIGVARNPASKGVSLGSSDFNKSKMETILGKQETEQLLSKLETERAIANTHNKIVEGSQTQMRAATDSDIALSKDNPKKGGGLAKYAIPAIGIASEIGGHFAGLPIGSGSVLGTGASIIGAGTGKIVSMGKNKIVDLLEKERNLNLAKMALPISGSEERAKLISDLESRLPVPKQSMLSRISSRLPISP